MIEFAHAEEQPPCGGVTCFVSGEIDLATADELCAHILDAYAAHGAPVTLDLSGVTFMDVSGLHVLLRVRARISASDGAGALRLRGLPRGVLRLLALAGVAPLFDATSTA